MKHIRSKNGVYFAEFDQCMFGLVSKQAKKPVKKRTAFLTNSAWLHNKLHGQFCNGQHSHQAIQGNEGGMKRSTAAQEYPPKLVEVVCSAILAEQRRAVSH